MAMETAMEVMLHPHPIEIPGRDVIRRDQGSS